MELPEITVMFVIISSLVSFLACMFSCIAWWWAGLILLPILLFLDIPYVNALASHKIAVWFIWIWSWIRYLKENILDKKILLISWIAPLPFVIFWTKFSDKIPWELMKPILWVVIIVMVVFSYFFNKKQKKNLKKEITNKDLLLMVTLLSPIGFMNWWISAWSWFFVTLVYLYVLKYDYLKSVAMMICANGIFWNITWAIAHIFLWHVMWALAPWLIIWAIWWSYVWAHIVIKKWNNFVRVFFLSTAILIWSLLIWSWVKSNY